MHRIGTTKRTLFLWLVAEAGVACAGADAKPARAPAMSTDPLTVEEAQEQIAQAQRTLAPAGEARDERPTSPAAEPAPAPSSETSDAQREAKAEDPCATRCRALASMKRAVVALCRMTGDDDGRCTDAKRTLTESTARVSSCRCEGR
ncbi:MAG TPA: hypothetical protein VM925_06660 [Labilithrix sp.]|nr:hypothetical protein [Labilithrix sp.]